MRSQICGMSLFAEQNQMHVAEHLEPTSLAHHPILDQLHISLVRITYRYLLLIGLTEMLN